MSELRKLEPPRDPDAPVPIHYAPQGIDNAQAFAGGMPREWAASLEEEGGGGIPWRRYVAAALRYKWLILIVTIVGTVAGAAAARLLKPVFRAEGTVWIEGDQEGPERGPIRTAQLLDTRSWVQLIFSYEVLEPVVLDRRLFIVPDNPSDHERLSDLLVSDRFATGDYTFTVGVDGSGFTLALEGMGSESGVFGDSAGVGFGLLWVPDRSNYSPGQSISFELLPPRGAAAGLRERLDARVDPDGNFMMVDLTDTDQQAVAATLDAVMDRYIELAGELKRARLTYQRQVLEDQLQSASGNLAAAEQRLQEFKVNTITLPGGRAQPIQPGVSETQDPVIRRFFEMQTEQAQVQRDRDALTRVLGQATDSTLSVESLEFIETARSSPELQQLLTQLRARRADRAALLSRYTEEYGPVQQHTADIRELERAAIPGQVRALIVALDQRQQELTALIGEASESLQQIPRRSIQEAGFERAAETAENVYTEIRQRTEQARLAEASTVPDVQVLSRPVVPDRPFRNQAPQLLIIGFVASLAVGIGAALLLDRMDRRVRYPDQVSGFGLSILGAVPRTQKRSKGLNRSDMNQVVEALRGIRLNLVHAHGAAGPIVITVTSPGPGDGKSFISSNLALAFSEAGHKTLVIDGDVRKGQLHRLFGVERKPGLTEVLNQGASVQSAVVSTTYANLDILPCGTRSSRAPELLGSAQMAQLLARFRGTYGVIIVDSPPMGAGVDAFALGTLTGNLVMVLRTGETDREMTEAKLETLNRLPIRILGVVLNDVRTGREGGFYYGYYSYYLPGYEAEDEDTQMDENRLIQRVES